MKISIYNYTDYREFLKEYYDLGKSEGSGMSFRSMSQSMGFKSPNYLKLIIDGDRHIGKSGIPKITEGLKLKKLESEYFSYLVFFAKASTPADKNFYFGQLVRMRMGKDVATIDDTQLAYYEQWFTPIVRELIVGKKQDSIDYGELSNSIIPPIHHKQLLYSVSLLEKLGFIVIDENGVYQYHSSAINSKNEVSSFAVKQFHKKMISLASDSIDNFSRDEREISSVTLRVSDNGFSNIKKRIQEFREEILQMVKDDCGGDQVTQLNFQLFPVAQEKKND